MSSDDSVVGRTAVELAQLVRTGDVSALSIHISGVSTMNSASMPSEIALPSVCKVSLRQSGYPEKSVSHMPPTRVRMPRR